MGTLPQGWMAHLRPGGLGHNTALTTGGLVTRAMLQATYLILLSRWLGAERYGLFAGSVASAILLAPLAGWGMGFVFTERLAQRQVSAPVLWGAVARLAFGSGLTFAVLVTAATAGFLAVRVSLADMALLALAELAMLPLVQVATMALLALGRGGLAALAMCLVPATRVAAAAVLVTLASPSIHAIALSHCAGSVLGAGVAMLLATRLARAADAPVGTAQSPGTLVHAGAPYAASALAATSYTEVDKVLILQLIGASAAGTYTVAYRIVSVLVLPVTALLGNALPKLFTAGATRERQRLLRIVLVAVGGYGVFAAMLALGAAPLVPALFGKGYEASSHFVVLLAAWLPLVALRQYAATALTASGRQLARLWAEGAGLVLIVVLNVLLLPRLGAAGAVLSLVATEVFMVAACWRLFLRRQRSLPSSAG